MSSCNHPASSYPASILHLARNPPEIRHAVLSRSCRECHQPPSYHFKHTASCINSSFNCNVLTHAIGLTREQLGFKRAVSASPYHLISCRPSTASQLPSAHGQLEAPRRHQQDTATGSLAEEWSGEVASSHAHELEDHEDENPFESPLSQGKAAQLRCCCLCTEGRVMP